MIFVIYVNYSDGVEFQTGPEEARFRAGLWAHFYRRQHPRTCSCLHCLKRISLGPVDEIPQGIKAGRMYPVI